VEELSERFGPDGGAAGVVLGGEETPHMVFFLDREILAFYNGAG